MAQRIVNTILLTLFPSRELSRLYNCSSAASINPCMAVTTTCRVCVCVPATFCVMEERETELRQTCWLSVVSSIFDTKINFESNDQQQRMK